MQIPVLHQIAALGHKVYDHLTLRGIALDVFMKPMDYDTEYDWITETEENDTPEARHEQTLQHDVAVRRKTDEVAVLRRAHGEQAIHGAMRGTDDRTMAAV